MKISNHNIVNNYTDLHLHAKDSSVSRSVSESGHSYDAIIIQSDPKKIEEKTFAETLIRQLSSEIRSTASEEKLQDLKNRIHSGTYQVNPQTIAARMLLIREDIA